MPPNSTQASQAPPSRSASVLLSNGVTRLEGTLKFTTAILALAAGVYTYLGVREEHFMPRHLEPKLSILPAAQRQIWIVKSGSLSMLIRVADMRAVSARQK